MGRERWALPLALIGGISRGMVGERVCVAINDPLIPKEDALVSIQFQVDFILRGELSGGILRLGEELCLDERILNR